MSRLLILGAGGHGKVVAEAAETMNKWNEISFLDSAFPDLSKCLSWQIIGDLSSISTHADSETSFLVAFGDNKKRYCQLGLLKEEQLPIATIIHNSAVISKSAIVQDGTVILAGSIINAKANIGLGCIINTSSTVDHDCELGNAVHLSPGVNLGGSVRIGKCSWLGVGSSVINNISIGDNVTVGAGSVVVSDIEFNQTVVGVPAKPIKQ